MKNPIYITLAAALLAASIAAPAQLTGRQNHSGTIRAGGGIVQLAHCAVVEVGWAFAGAADGVSWLRCKSISVQPSRRAARPRHAGSPSMLVRIETPRGQLELLLQQCELVGRSDTGGDASSYVWDCWDSLGGAR